jgi:polyphosphate glucokinase
MKHKDGRPLWEHLGRAGLKRLGKDTWRKLVKDVVLTFAGAFLADYVVIGGGNAKVLKELPPMARRGNNLTAFRGGFRLWSLDDVPTHAVDGAPPPPKLPAEWRVI